MESTGKEVKRENPSQRLSRLINRQIVKCEKKRKIIISSVANALSQKQLRIKLPSDYDPCVQGPANTFFDRLTYDYKVSFKFDRLTRSIPFYPGYKDEISTITFKITGPLKQEETVRENTITPAIGISQIIYEMIIAPLSNRMIVEADNITPDLLVFCDINKLKILAVNFSPTTEALAGMFWKLMSNSILRLEGIFIRKISVSYQGFATFADASYTGGSFSPSPYLIKRIYGENLINCDKHSCDLSD